jgi:hypothetical protein
VGIFCARCLWQAFGAEESAWCDAARELVWVAPFSRYNPRSDLFDNRPTWGINLFFADYRLFTFVFFIVFSYISLRTILLVKIPGQRAPDCGYALTSRVMVSKELASGASAAESTGSGSTGVAESFETVCPISS